MNILSVAYKNFSLPNVPPTDFIIGNVGDTIKCFITVRTATPIFGSMNLCFNLIQNSDNPSAANPNRTKNLQTQNEQNYKGDIGLPFGSVSTLTLRNPKQAATISNVVVTSVNIVPTNLFTINFDFIIAPYILPNNASGDVLTIPNFFNNTESLKPYFEIKIYPNELDTTILDSGNNYDNATINAKSGNVGYFNEKFNGISAPYELVNFLYSNSLINLDPQQNCIGTAKVKSNASAFNSNTRLQLFVFQLKEKDNFVNTQTFNQNQTADNTIIFAINSTVNSTNGILTQCKAIINGSDIDITFTIPANKVNTQFCVYAKIFESTTVASNPNYCNVLLKLDTPEVALFNPITIQNYLGTSYPISFRYHTETTIDNCPNHVKGFVGDWYQGLFRVRENNNAEVQNISISIVRLSGAVLDSGYIISTNSLPFALEQPYNLVSGDWRQEVSVIKVGNFYECKFAFIIREDWVAFNDIVFRVVISGTQNGLTFGGDDYTYNASITANTQNGFILYDYELPINLPTDAQAIGFTSPESSKQFYLVSNPTIKADFLFAGFDTLTQCKFRASNTNDLEAILSDLVAYLTINYDNGAEETKQSIHSIWGVSDNCPFTQPAGGVAIFPKIEILDIETAMVSANIIWDKIVELGFSQSKMKVTWRLDKKLPPLYLERYLLHARGNNAVGNFQPFISFTSAFSDFIIIDVLNATTNINYKYSEDLVPNWNAISPVPKATVLNQIALGSGVFKIQVCPDINVGLSECTIIFAITKEGIAPANSWSYNFANTNSIDTVLGFDNLVQFTSVAGAGANTFYNIRLSALTEWSQPVSFSLINLNFDILALVATSTPFELQIIDISNANLTLTYNYV
jgi:hypothetical protein